MLSAQLFLGLWASLAFLGEGPRELPGLCRADGHCCLGLGGHANLQATRWSKPTCVHFNWVANLGGVGPKPVASVYTFNVSLSKEPEKTLWKPLAFLLHSLF